MPKAEIEVPEGMTAEKLLELVTSYETRRVQSGIRNKTRREAAQDVLNAHKDEYEAAIKKHTPRG